MPAVKKESWLEDGRKDKWEVPPAVHPGERPTVQACLSLAAFVGQSYCRRAFVLPIKMTLNFIVSAKPVEDRLPPHPHPTKVRLGDVPPWREGIDRLFGSSPEISAAPPSQLYAVLP